MQDYLCQMVDYDDPEEWSAIKAFDAEDAARDYAEKCDSRSAGGLFTDTMQDKQTVLVKQDGDPQRFEISFDYSKYFYAHSA